MKLAAKRHILLIGGTGACGLIFTRAALEAGHTVTLYVRTPSKIPTHLTKNPNLNIIEGTLEDIEGLKRAAACGADVFVSLAGPTLGNRNGTPITDALKVFYPFLLESAQIKRVLVLSTASYSAPEDTSSLKWWVAINCYVRVLGGDSYSEIRGIAEETVALAEKVEWTVFRVPLLNGKTWDENPGDVNAAYVGDNKRRDGLFLDRGRLAQWVLNEMDEGKWISCCPLVSNA